MRKKTILSIMAGVVILTGVGAVEKTEGGKEVIKRAMDSSVCGSIMANVQRGNIQLLDEFELDHTRAGVIALPSDKVLYFPQIVDITLAAKVSPSSISTLTSKTQELTVTLSHTPANGGPITVDKYNTTLTYSNTVNINRSGALKRVKYSNGVIYFTFGFSYLTRVEVINISYAGPGVYLDRLQLSSGTVEQFPGFTDYINAPCSLDNYVIEDRKTIFLDFDYDKRHTILENIISNTVAFDREDNRYIYPWVVSDQYSPNIDLLGQYFPIVLKAIDSAGNTSLMTYQIKTVDKVLPTINKKTNDAIKMSYKILSQEKLLENFTFADNYRLAKKEIKNIDFEAAKKKPGEYSFTVSATDSSGNIATLTSKVLIIDDVAPIIEGPSVINFTTSLEKTDEAIRALFTVSDEIDGDLSFNLDAKEYHDNYNKPGKYDIKITGRDKSNNTSTKQFTVIVTDDSGPVFMVYESKILLYQGEEPAMLELINKLAQTDVIPAGKYVSYTTLNGKDIIKNMDVGTHELRLSTVKDDGTSILIDLKVEILAKVEGKKPNFFQSIGNFFSVFFRNIRNFFSNLFR